MFKSNFTSKLQDYHVLKVSFFILYRSFWHKNRSMTFMEVLFSWNLFNLNTHRLPFYSRCIMYINEMYNKLNCSISFISCIEYALVNGICWLCMLLCCLVNTILFWKLDITVEPLNALQQEMLDVWMKNTQCKHGN